MKLKYVSQLFAPIFVLQFKIYSSKKICQYTTLCLSLGKVKTILFGILELIITRLFGYIAHLL